MYFCKVMDAIEQNMCETIQRLKITLSIIGSHISLLSRKNLKQAPILLNPNY